MILFLRENCVFCAEAEKVAEAIPTILLVRVVDTPEGVKMLAGKDRTMMDYSIHVAGFPALMDEKDWWIGKTPVMEKLESLKFIESLEKP